MKILCVIDILGAGGAQRQLVNLAIGFKERGHTVSFLVYHHHDFYVDILSQNNIPIHEIIEANYLKRLIKMRKFIRKGNFDAVLSFLQASNFISEIAGLPSRRWKLVVGERSANPSMFKSIKRRLFRWFHLFADHIVANSHENIKMIREINPLLCIEKCHVIYNTVNFDIWKPDSNYIPLRNGRFNLTVLASHRNLKNLNGLVEAVNLLPNKDKEKLKIEWYGSDGNDSSKEQAIKKIERYDIKHIFHFYEPTNQIHKKVQHADAVGLFSHIEGLPNAVCEGMAAGKPVIASNVSDIPLLIKKKEFLFNPSSPSDIANVVYLLINTDLKELKKIGEINRTYAKKIFHRDNIINAYLELLKNE